MFGVLVTDDRTRDCLGCKSGAL